MCVVIAAAFGLLGIEMDKGPRDVLRFQVS